VLLRALPILCLLAFMLIPGAPAAEPDNADVRKAAEAVTRDLEVQSRLPTDSGTPEADQPRRTTPFPSLGTSSFFIPGGKTLFTLFQWSLIAIAALALLALVAIFFREPLEDRFRPVIYPSGAPPGPAPPRANALELLAQADLLAAEGRYADAMHCVLLAAMSQLGATVTAADSLTSWELLRTASLADAQAHTLRDLIVRVERAWFGRFPASPEDYREVRAVFDNFAAAGSPL
jgi:hypothetical protein